MTEPTEAQERRIRQYVEGELRDDDDPVTLVQHIGRRRVGGETRELYDVTTVTGRWWVITDLTNMYDQVAFPSVETAFTYHLGLMMVLRERQRTEPDDNVEEYVSGPWRRFASAADAMGTASEAEDYQAVGVRCREVLLALVAQHAGSDWVPALDDPPRRADFKGWAAVFAEALTTGRSRRYLKGLAETTWDLAVWLQHYGDATEWDAEIMLDATAHLLNVFAVNVVKYERGQPRRCPTCESYRVSQDGDRDVVDGVMGWRSWDACAACGWASPTTFAAWDIDDVETEENTPVVADD